MSSAAALAAGLFGAIALGLLVWNKKRHPHWLHRTTWCAWAIDSILIAVNHAMISKFDPSLVLFAVEAIVASMLLVVAWKYGSSSRKGLGALCLCLLNACVWLCLLLLGFKELAGIWLFSCACVASCFIIFSESRCASKEVLSIWMLFFTADICNMAAVENQTIAGYAYPLLELISSAIIIGLIACALYLKIMPVRLAQGVQLQGDGLSLAIRRLESVFNFHPLDDQRIPGFG